MKQLEAPSVFDHSHHAYHRRTLGQHGAHILMLWIVLLGFGLAGGLMLLTVATRVQQLEQKSGKMVDLQVYVTQQEMRLSQLIEAVKQLSPSVPSGSRSEAPSVPSGSGSVPVTSDLMAPISSPSGALSRGSVSADGSKFAGYEDVKPGKKGVAVELLKDATTARKERYIVIFNALTESTGIGTSYEKEMSVRWKDAQTIEYDVLVKQKSGWKKETRSIQIYF